MTATLTSPIKAKIEEPVYVNSLAIKTAEEIVTREYGDSATLGEPFRDKNNRVFCKVFRNGKEIDNVYIGMFDEQGKEVVGSTRYEDLYQTSFNKPLSPPLPPPEYKPTVAAPIAKIEPLKGK